MDGEKRRNQIMEILNREKSPISGMGLAGILKVSRQVVVQDIALLRAENKQIMSTNKGYILPHPSSDQNNSCMRVFRVNHKTEDTLDELQTIVDYGGRVLNVFIEHGIYGQICVDLIINNRLEAAEFVNTIENSGNQPLKALTGDCHYHTVVADSEKNLDRIEEELRKKGYLAVDLKPYEAEEK